MDAKALYLCSSCQNKVPMVYGPTFCMACTASGRHVDWFRYYESLRSAGMAPGAAQETTEGIFRAMEAR